MKLSQGLAAVALTFSAMAAHAEITGTVTVVSDYDFRGITQTAQDPALQGSLDYAHDSGFYIGAWASNVDFGDDADIEIDYYGGFRGGEDITYDVGLIWYSYPSTDAQYDFGEVYASAGYKWVSGKIWYSPDFGSVGDSAFYYEANGSFELPANFGATAHIGYSDGDYWENSEYTDWSVGLTYSLSHFTMGLKWIDGSDLEILDGTPDDVISSEARAVFSVSTSFPWSNE